MPIKQLQSDTPGLPRAGVIRLGYKVETGKKDKNGNPGFRPVEADHFVLTDAPGVAEAVGTDKPTELKVFFPFDDINLVFPAYMQQWQASALVCRGDGEHITYAIDPTTGKQKIRDGIALMDFTEGQKIYKAGQVMPCPGPERGLYPKCQFCKPNAMLIVLLRDVPRLAYWQISTTSIHNIVDLTKQLNTVKETIGQIIGTPRLTGVPFILKRVKRSVSTPKNGGGRQRMEKWFLQLEIEADWVMKMLTAQRRLADPMARFMLAPGPQQPQAQPVMDIIEPEPVAVKAPFGFAEPPQWEPVEEPEFTEEPEPTPSKPEQPEQPKPEPAQSNGKLTRPMTPEQVKQAAAVKSARNTKPASETQLDYAASSLSKAVDGDDKKRHSITKYLFGFESLKNATAGQASFIIDWIGAKKENEYAPEPDALKEVEMILRQFLVDAGQVEMTLPEVLTETPDPNDLNAWFPRQEEIDF